MNPAERDSATIVPIVSIRWLAAAWFAFAIFDASRTVVGMYAVGMRHEWLNLFWLYFLAWLPWPLATPAILRLAQQPLFGRPTLRAWAAVGGGCVVMFVISSVWFACLDTVLEPWLTPGQPAPFGVKLGAALNGWTVPAVVIYALLLALGVWLRSRETLARQRVETARLSEQLALAELNALRQQLEPHFLFNTLNGIVGLLRERRIEPAISTIVDLSELLRGTLQRANRPCVTLLEELELLARYLEIQKARFGERLAVEIDVPAALYRLQVPAPLLQPLVENAIKHGIEQRAAAGRIRVRAARRGAALHLSVYNDGPSLAEARGRAEPGIGIANLRKRLGILFDGRSSLELTDREAGVEVAVSLPIEVGAG